MTAYLNEDALEELALSWFEEVGYSITSGDVLMENDERKDFQEVILEERLREAIFTINKDVTNEVVDEAIRIIKNPKTPNLLTNNRAFHKFITDGVFVETREDNRNVTKQLFLVDFENIGNNDFLAVQQLLVKEGNATKRPDIVLFINGLPLVVIELKNATDEYVGTTDAYNQLQTYKSTIQNLFNYNEILVTSDGHSAYAGTITSNEERFMAWKTIDGKNIQDDNITYLEVLIKGMLVPKVLLDLIQNFILFKDDGKNIIKILAAYHQYHAVNRALEETVRATDEKGDRKIGVVWHTQGSGKSLSMVFYSGKLIQSLGNPTIVVITDRNDLDDQLFTTFSESYELLRTSAKQAGSRAELKELLDVNAGGIVFSTMQKFSPENGDTMDTLTQRRNVIVMADEAHRSQYGFSGKIHEQDDDYIIKYGYAKYLRDALPNASYIGFTGTPISTTDKSTRAVFGDYIDVYDMTQAVEDGATVKIYYESRIIPLELEGEDSLDSLVEEVFEEQEDYTVSKSKSKWSGLEAVAGANSRLKTLAKDFVNHFETRQKAAFGKSMIVAMSRRIAIDLYKEIIALRPEWHSDDDNKGKIKTIMTGSSSDPEEWQKYIGNKSRKDLLARRMKDNNDELQIVIVVDMWLTGFDVPSLNTLYVDKPMSGHNLMQAIARVNRVFKDKVGGLVVDYIGIADNLKEALKEYTPSDQKQAGINSREAVLIMLEKHDLVTDMLYGYDYSNFNSRDNKEKMKILKGTMNYVIGKGEETEKDFKDTVTELTRAYALCSTEPEAQELNEEIAFFKAVKVGLIKLSMTKNAGVKSPAQIDAELKQLLSKSIVSNEVIDLYDTLGIDSPDISILSDQFLDEVKNLPEKNLALRLLENLLKGKIKSVQRQNKIEARKYSEMLKNSLKKYNMRALNTNEVIEELINMSKDMQEARKRGENLGLTDDELAFYDALADHETAKEVLGDDTLKLIAQELTKSIKNNMTVDWAIRESARARMRVDVKKLLKKHGYPPDAARKAVNEVVEQAELMASNGV